MNLEMMLEVADAVKKADHFDMTSWGFCIAGITCKTREMPTVSPAIVSYTARQLLGIDNVFAANELFFRSEWPLKYRLLYVLMPRTAASLLLRDTAKKEAARLASLAALWAEYYAKEKLAPVSAKREEDELEPVA